MGKKKEESSGFPAKWEKVLKSMPEFKETADAASTEELKKIIYQAEGNIYTIEKEKEADEKLNAAKELCKDLSASYKEAEKYQKAKVKYALFLLDGRGEDLNSKEE